MAETQQMKQFKTPSKGTPRAKHPISLDHHIAPQTPQSATPSAINLRRSHRLTAATPEHRPALSSFNTPKSTAKTRKICEDPPSVLPTEISINPASPPPVESRKKRKFQEKSAEKGKDSRNVKCKRAADRKVKKKVYYKRVVYDDGEFSAGGDVYVKRRSDASSDDEDPEVEECRVCFKPAAGRRVLIECDDCLNGFHLKCLKPPLKAVPDGDWVCCYCVARKNGEVMEFPEPQAGKKRARTAREKLLSSDLWAARIERFVLSKFWGFLFFSA